MPKASDTGFTAKMVGEPSGARCIVRAWLHKVRPFWGHQYHFHVRLACPAGVVLFVSAGAIYVGIGSDHTDRDLERTSIVASKQAFSKIIGRRVWPLDRLQPDWDRFALRSWVTHEGVGVRTLYQEGAVASMMTPVDLLNLIPTDQRGDGLVLFSGTVPAASEAPSSGACRFEGELLDGSGGVLASCGYSYQAS